MVVEKNLPRDETQLGTLAIEHRLAPGGFLEEVQAILRFWRRRAYFCFIPCDAPNGESDFTIDLGHLAFALSKVRHYQELLDKRDR